MKRLTLHILIVFISLLAVAEVQGQSCSAEAEWTFDPAPVDGLIPAGTTVEICVNLQSFSPAGAGWLFGMELDFPDAWQLSTLNILSAPEVCNSNGGEWLYLDTIDCGEQRQFSAGFYFDSNLDGNVCNNWGDVCAPTGANQSFCIEVTLGYGTNGENILPRVGLITEYTGGWGPYPCPDPIYVQPDYPFLLLNGIDISSGESPGSLAICESQCLFDLLENADEGGVWTGSDGYVDSSDCGYFDVDVNTLGDYTYTVTGDGTSSTTISVVEADLGVVASEYFCYPTISLLNLIAGEFPTDGPGTELSNYLNGMFPEDGVWTDPNGNVVPNGIFIIGSMSDGMYNYHFYSELGCPTSVQLHVVGHLLLHIYPQAQLIVVKMLIFVPLLYFNRCSQRVLKFIQMEIGYFTTMKVFI